MTYRDRRLARAARLRDWADRREHKAESADARFRAIADHIPLGQPILVGHHSERRHRRDVSRMESALVQGHEHRTKARDMDARADEIERQADRAIYRDDHNALDALRDRIAELEARRARMKAINAEVRKGAGWSERITPTLTAEERKDLEMAARFNQCIGYPPYALQNLSGNIARQRKRLDALVAESEQRARVRAIIDAERAAEGGA